MTGAPPISTAPEDRGSDAILTRLMSLHPKVIDLSLGRTQDLLERLGRPQDRLPPVVHVAGTNGKGSTIATIRAIAEAAGLKVHVYASPHLTRFHERIRLAGTLIAEDALADLLAECETVNQGRPITFFEITTCAAFKAFSETPADLLLLETGLGGRLDSTNVVDHPAATVITPVSMDHVQFLGDTLLAIAAEKAAIQKPDTASIIGPQTPEVMALMSDQAQRVGAPLARHGLEWSITPSGDAQSFYFESPSWSGTIPGPNLPGAHQVQNMAMAIAACLVLRDLGIDIPDTALRSGVVNVEWPARLQVLTHGPIPQALPDWTVTLDGGHNAAAGTALAVELARWADQDRLDFGVARPVHVICGMLNSKAATDFLSPLAPYLASFQAIEIPGEENSFAADTLATMARQAGIDEPNACASLSEAIALLTGHSTSSRLLICGSLYLAGRLLAQNS